MILIDGRDKTPVSTQDHMGSPLHIDQVGLGGGKAGTWAGGGGRGGESWDVAFLSRSPCYWCGWSTDHTWNSDMLVMPAKPHLEDKFTVMEMRKWFSLGWRGGWRNGALGSATSWLPPAPTQVSPGHWTTITGSLGPGSQTALVILIQKN